MKLLLDANLSWRLVEKLRPHFSGCQHVDTIVDLPKPATDTEIWLYALQHDCILVSNDDDFLVAVVGVKWWLGAWLTNNLGVAGR